MSPRKSERISLRVDQEMKDRLERTASIANLSLSEFIIKCAASYAGKIIGDGKD